MPKRARRRELEDDVPVDIVSCTEGGKDLVGSRRVALAETLERSELLAELIEDEVALVAGLGAWCLRRHRR